MTLIPQKQLYLYGYTIQPTVLGCYSLNTFSVSPSCTCQLVMLAHPRSAAKSKEQLVYRLAVTFSHLAHSIVSGLFTNSRSPWTWPAFHVDTPPAALQWPSSSTDGHWHSVAVYQTANALTSTKVIYTQHSHKKHCSLWDKSNSLINKVYWLTEMDTQPRLH